MDGKAFSQDFILISYIKPFILVFMSAFLIGISLPISLGAVLLASMVLAVLGAWLTDRVCGRVGAGAGILYTGSRRYSVRDQYSGHLTRARYLKSGDRHQEALALIDEYLEHVPDDKEALLIKAQTLIDMSGNLVLAGQCLKTIRKQTPPDDPYHRWARELMGALKTRACDGGAESVLTNFDS